MRQTITSLLALSLFSTACLGNDDPSPGTNTSEANVNCSAYITRAVNPSYPQLAMSKKINGMVTVTFDLDGSGKAVNGKIIESIPVKTFDASALRALNAFRFEKGVAQSNCSYRFQWSLM